MSSAAVAVCALIVKRPTFASNIRKKKDSLVKGKLSSSIVNPYSLLVNQSSYCLGCLIWPWLVILGRYFCENNSQVGTKVVISYWSCHQLELIWTQEIIYDHYRFPGRGKLITTIIQEMKTLAVDKLETTTITTKTTLGLLQDFNVDNRQFW